MSSFLLDRLFRQHAGYLRRVAYRVTRCSDHASDVVQEAFLKFQKAGYVSTKPEAEHLRLLEKIVFRVALNLIRTSYWKLTDPLDFEWGTEAPNSDPYDILWRARAMAEVARAWGDLTGRQKAVFSLKCLHGLRRKDIARKLNIGEESVKSHLSVARQKLAKTIRGYA